jgi:NAD(P)-dependent dehydrogenase (short-subunit alcohol dehydrogenase family)
MHLKGARSTDRPMGGGAKPLATVDSGERTSSARIITTASEAHRGATIPFNDLNAERGYRGFGRYGETKLANILFATELARRLEGTGVTANCFHPGVVATDFNRNNGLLMDLGMMILRPFSRSPRKGSWQRRPPRAFRHRKGR